MKTSPASQTVDGIAPPSMRLGDLLGRALGRAWQAAGPVDRPIHDICQDSRQAVPGALFVAISGGRARGAAFIAEAARRGAVAVVAEEEVAAPEGMCRVRVADARIAVARLAAAFFGLDAIQAAGGLTIAGITGTNGKSTLAYMVRSILAAAGRRPALLGTIEYDLRRRRLPAELTTPEPIRLVRHLIEAHGAGADHAVLEVSSHSLDQHRTAGLRFSIGVFTNLTQDHLDYHGSAAAYLRAKRRLFESLAPEATAVVNADDAASEAILSGCAARVIRYGLGAAADVRAKVLSEDGRGVRFRIEHGDDSAVADTALVGRHNISNALGAAAAGLALGVDLGAIRRGLSDLACVPGRLQRVESGDRGFEVFVDYAHTEDALRHALRALRPLTRGRLWCVFGCGGDRDRSKRPLMARAVSEGADRFVVTSDNPRTEDPMAIIADIEQGLNAAARRRGLIEADRARAIGLAVEQLAADDTLLIAGKGHETYQILGSRRIHFDDVEAARAALARR